MLFAFNLSACKKNFLGEKNIRISLEGLGVSNGFDGELYDTVQKLVIKK
jgi:hypothetical protein